MGRHALTPPGCLVTAAALQAGCKTDHLSKTALGHTRRRISALKFHAVVGGDLRCQIFYPLMNFHRSRGSPFERLSELVWVSTTWSKIYSSDPFTPTKIVKLGPKQLKSEVSVSFIPPDVLSTKSPSQNPTTQAPRLHSKSRQAEE